jgi:hypothetical protein
VGRLRLNKLRVAEKKNNRIMDCYLEKLQEHFSDSILIQPCGIYLPTGKDWKANDLLTYGSE